MGETHNEPKDKNTLDKEGKGHCDGEGDQLGHGHLDKWNIEQKHEYLMSALPLYRKVSLALMPPLQNSLDFIRDREEGEGEGGKKAKGKRERKKEGKEGERSNGSNGIDGSDGVSGIGGIDGGAGDKIASAGDNTPTAEESISKSSMINSDTPPKDDEDVACPIGEQNVLDSFLGMLTTAAGADSWKHFRSLFAKDSSRPSLVGYMYESELESESGLDLERPQRVARRVDDLRRSDTRTTLETGTTETGTAETATTETATADATLAESTLADLAETKRSHSTRSRKSPKEANRTDSGSAVFGSTVSGSVSATASAPLSEDSPFSNRVPPATERTPWQNSVLQNIDFSPAGDHVLVKYTHDNLEHDALDVLAWLAAKKLQHVFALADDDYFYGRFGAWLIKDVVLQGHIYVTRDALCFYSVVPGELTDTELSDPDLTLHAGALGHKTAHYGDSYFLSVYTHRFWGVLKPQTLSIYNSPTDQYFPAKVIDLNEALYCEIVNGGGGSGGGGGGGGPQQAMSPAELSPPLLLRMTSQTSDSLLSQLGSETSSLEDSAEDVQSGVWFKIVCPSKTHRFHTGNIYSARHWCNSITKVIFQLHNCNALREVVLKVPIRDVLDLRKNFVLAGDVDEYDNDTPASFSFKYSTSQSRMDRLKRRAAPYDFAHCLLFQLGLDFERLVNKVLEGTADLGSVNSRFRHSAKKVWDDSLSVTRVPSSVISTLRPDVSPGISLVDKIALANGHLLGYRSEKLQMKLDDDAEGESHDKKKTMARLLSMIKPKIACDSTLPRGHYDSLSSSDTLWLEGRMSAMFESGEDSFNLQLPKPFSVLTLKNTKMLMITKRRPLAEIEAKYEQNRRQTERNSPKGLDSTSSYDDQFDVTTRDDADDDSITILSEPRTHKNKFKSLKRSIKTVSTMGGIWSSNPEHYDSSASDDPYYVADETDREVGVRHFRKHFSLPPDTELIASYYAHLRRSLPVYGKVYLGNDKLCFRSLLPGVSTKMILPLKELDACTKDKGKKINYSGLHIHALSGKDLVLEFGTKKARDDAHDMIVSRMTSAGNDFSRFQPENQDSRIHSEQASEEVKLKERLREESVELAQTRVRAARLRLLEDKIGVASGIEFPLILEDDPIESTEVKPAESYHFVLLTIGSRGDVQPYIALGKGLIAEGHKVTIATHSEFEEWIVSYGINFKEVAGNPAELMSLMVTHGSMSVSFLKEASAKFKGWIGELLQSSWDACQDADILIESPSAMSGIHIAEALGIPYMRAFTMPWTRTRAYPHAFIVPDSKKGGSYNYLTHVMFENVFWKGISGQVNRWRVETLGLRRTNLVKLQQYRIPFLYNVSPAMFPPSVDYPDWVKVTGYWFLDEGSLDYNPPQGLVDFLAEAKRNNEKVVYIGFGSIVVSDSKKLTKAVVEAVMELGVKCILNKGWSDRGSGSKDEIEVELPDSIYDSGSIPHDWLFSQIDAAVHHGGSGTTGATMRAGLPSIIKPFFGDQFFYGSLVEERGVGMLLKTLNAKSLTKALKTITTEEKYLTRAQAVAQAMEHETGVLTAIAAIYSELAYARSIIMTIRHNTELRKGDDRSGAQTPNAIDEMIAFVRPDKSGDGTESDSLSDSGSESDSESGLSLDESASEEREEEEEEEERKEEEEEKKGEEEEEEK